MTGNYSKEEIRAMVETFDLTVQLHSANDLYNIKIPNKMLDNLIRDITYNSQMYCKEYIIFKNSENIKMSELIKRLQDLQDKWEQDLDVYIVERDGYDTYSLEKRKTTPYLFATTVSYKNKDAIMTTIEDKIQQLKSRIQDDFYDTIKLLEHTEFENILNDIRRKKKLKRIING